MTLRQAINVIMGANVGKTVTAWVVSFSGIILCMFCNGKSISCHIKEGTVTE